MAVLRTLLCSAIGGSVWLVALTGGQTAPGKALSAELSAHLQNERLQVVTSVRGLPLGVRNALQMLFQSQSLDIAEPGAEYDVTGTGAYVNLPVRRLVAAGCSYDHCLVYYERRGTSHTWHVALFHWSPEETTLEWGGTAGGGLKAIDDVRGATLSGAIKATPGPW